MTDVLRGYTLADIDRLAAYATRINPWYRGMDVVCRYEAAYDAIVDRLLAADEPPPAYELKAAGRTACDHWVRSQLAQRGWTPEHGNETAPRFSRYWWQRDRPSFDERIVDEIAVTQIWPTLTRTQQQALYALAMTGDYTLAAAALGKSYGCAKQHISRARRAVRALWHEHETPRRRMWGNDRRAGRRGDGGTADGLRGTRALAARSRRTQNRGTAA
jgi:DNA-directed RNA polymerase specialized sigma24 family protein